MNEQRRNSGGAEGEIVPHTRRADRSGCQVAGPGRERPRCASRRCGCRSQYTATHPRGRHRTLKSRPGGIGCSPGR